MKLPKKLFEDITIYDTSSLQKYFKAIFKELNCRRKDEEEPFFKKMSKAIKLHQSNKMKIKKIFDDIEEFCKIYGTISLFGKYKQSYIKMKNKHLGIKK